MTKSSSENSNLLSQLRTAKDTPEKERLVELILGQFSAVLVKRIDLYEQKDGVQASKIVADLKLEQAKLDGLKNLEQKIKFIEDGANLASRMK